MGTPDGLATPVGEHQTDWLHLVEADTRQTGYSQRELEGYLGPRILVVFAL
jgi:hypothetical protein